MDDVRQDTATSSSASKTANGTEVNGRKANGASTAAADGQTPTLAVPASVIEDSLRVTRESLEMVCEIDENGTT
jgi:hypothetical protein